MRKPVQRRSALCVAALLVAVLIVGCEDEAPGESMARGGDPSLVNKPPPGTDAPVTSGEAIPNPQWDKLKVHFLGIENDPSTGFVRATVGTVRDPFEPKLQEFVEREVIPDAPSEELEDPDDPPPLPVAGADTLAPVLKLSGLERFPARDYEVIMIRWGTSVNKAVVMDPEGSTYIATKDMKMGSDNGQIVDITRYEVVIKEDTRDEPVVLTIEPPILRISEDDGSTDRLFINQAAEIQ